MSFTLLAFYEAIAKHKGWFEINNQQYPSVILAVSNLYFFRESTNDDYILLFDPIIDIKQKELNKFTVFYYPDKVINITLRNLNVEQEVKANGT